MKITQNQKKNTMQYILINVFMPIFVSKNEWLEFCAIISKFLSLLLAPSITKNHGKATLISENVFASVKWLAGKVVSKMTYNVSSGTLNPTTPVLQGKKIQPNHWLLIHIQTEHTDKLPIVYSSRFSNLDV